MAIDQRLREIICEDDKERILEDNLRNMGFWQFVHLCNTAQRSGKFEKLFVALNAQTDQYHKHGWRSLLLSCERPIYNERYFLPEGRGYLASSSCNPFISPFTECSDTHQGIVGARLVDSQGENFGGSPLNFLYEL